MLENSRKKKMNSLSESGSPSGSSVSSVSLDACHSGGGNVIHDAHGNAIWEWGVATGVFTRIKANELLSMLDNPTLALEGECEFAGEWAGDPYNRR